LLKNTSLLAYYSDIFVFFCVFFLNFA